MKIAKLMAFLIAVTITTQLNASTTQTPSAPNTMTPQSGVDEDKRSIEEVTIQLLKEQVSSEQRNNERILETVYWALGVIGTLTFALIGFGWFANFRLYERDKENLKQTLQAEMSKAVSEGVAAVEQRSLSTLTQLAERVEKVRESIPDLVSQRIEGKLAPYARSVESIRDSVASLEIDLNNYQARYCYESGALSPGLHFANKAIQLSISAKKPLNVQHQLNTMEEHLTRGGAVLPTVLNDVIKTVESLDEEVTAAQKDRVLEKLRRFGPPEPSPNNSLQARRP